MSVHATYRLCSENGTNGFNEIRRDYKDASGPYGIDVVLSGHFKRVFDPYRIYYRSVSFGNLCSDKFIENIGASDKMVYESLC